MGQKLTANQVIALREIAAGKVTMGNTGYASFRIHGASPQVVGKLVSLRLAKWPKGAIGNQTCELTDDGRSALAELSQD